MKILRFHTEIQMAILYFFNISLIDAHACDKLKYLRVTTNVQL